MEEMRKAPIILIAATLAVTAILAYAALRPGGRRTGPPQAMRAPSAPLRPAPDIEITMYQGVNEVGGSTIALSSLWEKTGRPVVLNFWAGLCPPCRAEMPDLQKRYDAGGKDRYIMLAVDVGPYTGLGTRADGLALLRDLKITFPAGTVFDEDILAAYQIFGMPSTFFIAPDGMIVRKQIGLLTPAQMDDHIAELMRASGAK